MERKPPRSWAAPAYAVLAALFTAGVFVQVLLAGLGFFSDPAYLEWHVTFAHVLEIIPVLLVIVAVAGRYWHLPWVLALVTIVGFQLQYVWLEIRPNPASAFHVADAVLIFALGVEMSRRAGTDWMARRQRPDVPGEAADAREEV